MALGSYTGCGENMRDEAGESSRIRAAPPTHNDPVPLPPPRCHEPRDWACALQVRRLRVCMHTKDTSGRHLGGVIFFEKYIIVQLLWNMIILN